MKWLPEALGRYLEPARVLPLGPRSLSVITHSLWESYRCDNFARMKPSAICVDVSDACNLACAMCSRTIDRDPRKNPFMDLERYKNVFQQIQPAYVLISGYGETLLHKDISSIVEYSTRCGARTTIVSNGTLLDEEMANNLLNAELAKIKISIDAADPEVYARLRTGAELENVLKNIEKLIFMKKKRNSSLIIEIQMTIFRENVNQISKMLHLCHDRLPGALLYYQLMFTYGNQPAFVDLTLPMNHPEALEELSKARKIAESYDFKRSVGAIDFAVRQLTRDLSNSACYQPWYFCLVSTDGDIYPCCHFSIHGSSWGNLFQEPFEKIWNSEKMQNFRCNLRENRSSNPVCNTCRYEDKPMDNLFSILAKIPGLSKASKRFGAKGFSRPI